MSLSFLICEVKIYPRSLPAVILMIRIREDFPRKVRPEANSFGALWRESMGIIRENMDSVVQTHPSSHDHEGAVIIVKKMEGFLQLKVRESLEFPRSQSSVRKFPHLVLFLLGTGKSTVVLIESVSLLM